MSQNCRFCLKKFNKNEVYYGITEEIKQNFESLAQTKFILSTTKMNLICELCMRSLQVATLLKNQFIVNQRKFLHVDEIKAENSLHFEDTLKATSSGSFNHSVANADKPEKVLLKSLSVIKKDSVIKQNPANDRRIIVIKNPLNNNKAQQPVAKPHRVDARQLLLFQNQSNMSEVSNQHLAYVLKKNPVPKFEGVKPTLITKFEGFRPNLVTKSETIKPKLMTKCEAINQNPTTSSSIVDKLLLKFEKIDQNSTFKSSILGTSNIKTIKKSNRKKRLTIKALELIKQEELGFKCPFCEESFSSKQPLSVHLISVHKSEILECVVCRKKFFSLDELNSHIQEVHPKERNHVCSMCPKTYTSKVNLNKHILAKHPNSKYRCNLCLQTFDRFDAIRSHMVGLHPDIKFRDMFNLIAKVEA